VYFAPIVRTLALLCARPSDRASGAAPYRCPCCGFVTLDEHGGFVGAVRAPQPEEFRPERFLDGKPDTYVWIPFGGGVRRCIGAAFAEYEMRIVLREFVERAELRAPDSRPEKVKVRNITLAPGRGTMVSLDRPTG